TLFLGVQQVLQLAQLVAVFLDASQGVVLGEALAGVAGVNLDELYLGARLHPELLAIIHFLHLPVGDVVTTVSDCQTASRVARPGRPPVVEIAFQFGLPRKRSYLPRR